MAISRRNRYSRSTTGLNAIGFFAPQLIYTAAGTYAAFVTANTAALNGTMAIINWPALTVRTTALTAGLQFFIAQIVDGDVKRSPIMTHNGVTASVTNRVGPDFTMVRTTYTAPVLQSTIVGYNATTGDLGLVAGTLTTPINYTISARDTSPSTQPFPVQSGTITSRISTATKMTMTCALASDLINAVDLERSADINFVNVEVRHNGTLINLVTRTATFTNGSTVVVFDAAHGLVASTAAVITVVATGFSHIVTAITATTMTIDRPYQGVTFTTGAGGTSFVTVANLGTITATGLQFTSIVEDTTFVLSYQGVPVTTAPTVVTAWRQGSGAAWQMADMEKDTAVMSGGINQNAQFVQDLGLQSLFVTLPETSAVQYSTYICRFKNAIESMAYANEVASSYGYIILGIPSNGTNPDTTINTVLTGA